MNVNIIIADNHPVVVEGIKEALCRLSCITVQTHPYSILAEKLLSNWPKTPCDLLITDIKSPDAEGLGFIKQLRKSDNKLKILVFSRFEQTGLGYQVAKLGVSGFLTKSRPVSELLDAVNAILAGGHYFPNHEPHTADLEAEAPGASEPQLTKRESQILQLISRAMSNKQIAGELFISDQTVSVHRKNIMRKLRVSNTAGLVKAAYEYCLV
jgi:DNA-binding NarL/FixJ family response regulator